MPDIERASSSPPSAQRPAERPGSWLLKSLAWLLAAGLALGASVALLVGVGLAVAYPNLPEIVGLTDYRPKLPLRVISADGVMLGEFGEERRIFTPIAQIPRVMHDLD